MTLEGFKDIFWLEFIHRLWGRIMAIPLLMGTFLIYKNKLDLFKTRIKLVWVLALLQGAMGWYMVKSGLNKDPHVSPYRLTAHLLLAFSTFLVILSMVQDTWGKHKFHISKMLTLLILLTISMGGMVAGLKAGLIYNTFPFMGDHLWPAEISNWGNFDINHGLVQFIHRVLGTLTLVMGWMWFFKEKTLPHMTVALVITVQYVLGVLTLIYIVPVSLGVFHQVWALAVVGSLLWVGRRKDFSSQNQIA
jgi:cytochrome c oxidase assembly protein subunit 15